MLGAILRRLVDDHCPRPVLDKLERCYPKVRDFGKTCLVLSLLFLGLGAISAGYFLSVLPLNGGLEVLSFLIFAFMAFAFGFLSVILAVLAALTYHRAVWLFVVADAALVGLWGYLLGGPP